jgi:hypothetical protein
MTRPTYGSAYTQLARASWAVKRMMIAADHGPINPTDLYEAVEYTRDALAILGAIATRLSATGARNTTTRANDTEGKASRRSETPLTAYVYESTALTPDNLLIISDVDDSELLPGETPADALVRLHRAAVIRNLGDTE